MQGRVYRYNVCVFAYGQTGSGKTHTMEGPADDPGINFRTMQELFRVINSERKASHSHAISASIVEIYNEQARPRPPPPPPPHLRCQCTCCEHCQCLCCRAGISIWQTPGSGIYSFRPGTRESAAA